MAAVMLHNYEDPPVVHVSLERLPGQASPVVVTAQAAAGGHPHLHALHRNYHSVTAAALSSAAQLDQDLSELDLDVATVQNLYEAVPAGLAAAPAPAPAPSPSTAFAADGSTVAPGSGRDRGLCTCSCVHSILMKYCVKPFRAVQFRSREMEARYQEWDAKQHTTLSRMAVATVVIMLGALLIDLVTQRDATMKASSIGLFCAAGVLLALAAALVCLKPTQTWRFGGVHLSRTTRLNMAAVATALATAIFGILANSFEQTAGVGMPPARSLGGHSRQGGDSGPDSGSRGHDDPAGGFGGRGDDDHSDNYISFGVQVALTIFLSDGLQLQVLPFLLCTVFTHAMWIGFDVRSHHHTPIVLLLVCVPAIILFKARHLYHTHQNRRLEFQLQVQLVRYIKRQQTAEKALTEQRVEAARANIAKETHQKILGYACHELRNPLHGLKGCLSDLMTRCVRGHAVDSNDLWNLESIQASVDQMSRVTDDVLDLNKLQAGKLKVAHKPMDVRDVIGRVLVQYRSATAAISLNIADNVPRQIVSDPLRIAQILTNGITNALKYSKPNNPIAVAAGMQNNLVRFEVHNVGHGVGSIDTSKLFQLYERGVNEGSATIRGIGLGLPICKMLIRLLGGDIGLEDRSDSTVFWFTIPVNSAVSGTAPILASIHVLDARDTAGKVDETAASVREQWRPPPPGQGPLMSYWGRTVAAKPRRVLIVDDESINRRLLSRMLQNQSCDVQELPDGERVCTVLQTASPAFDLCILDIYMGQYDGREVVAELRRAGFDALPVIASTGNCSSDDIQSYKAAGFDGILSKPFSATDVSDILQAMQSSDLAAV